MFFWITILKRSSSLLATKARKVVCSRTFAGCVHFEIFCVRILYVESMLYSAVLERSSSLFAAGTGVVIGSCVFAVCFGSEVFRVGVFHGVGVGVLGCSVVGCAAVCCAVTGCAAVCCAVTGCAAVCCAVTGCAAAGGAAAGAQAQTCTGASRDKGRHADHYCQNDFYRFHFSLHIGL